LLEKNENDFLIQRNQNEELSCLKFQESHENNLLNETECNFIDKDENQFSQDLFINKKLLGNNRNLEKDENDVFDSIYIENKIESTYLFI